MKIVVAYVIASAFFGLSLLHVYWALGGILGKAAAIPRIGAMATFHPSPIATFAVATALAFCAATVACLANAPSDSDAYFALTWLGNIISAVLVLRAIGDFYLIGFFKRVRGTRFAHMDTLIFSPLCLVLAIGLTYVIAVR